MTVQVVIPSWINPRGGEALRHFAAGLKHLGVDHKTVSLEKAVPSTEPMVCWGVFKMKLAKRKLIDEVQQEQKRLGGKLVIIERGFVKRDDYYVIGLDDLNGRATFPHDQTVASDRWDLLKTPLLPWNNKGEEILVIGQVPWDTSCQHFNQAVWVHSTCEQLRIKYPKNEIVFRPHPLQLYAIYVKGCPNIDRVDLHRPLSEALAQAKVAITFSSTVGVDATIAGVPIIACDYTSMAYSLVENEIKATPKRPDRQPWANWLAYCQWNFREMSYGKSWEHLHATG